MTYKEKLIREYNKQKYREEVNSGHYMIFAKTKA
jgi:hypothetical protein